MFKYDIYTFTQVITVSGSPKAGLGLVNGDDVRLEDPGRAARAAPAGLTVRLAHPGWGPHRRSETMEVDCVTRLSHRRPAGDIRPGLVSSGPQRPGGSGQTEWR